MSKATTFEVGMTCDGCANAVKRILGKIEGVTSIETDISAQTVIVQSDENVSQQELLERLKKWGSASGKSVALKT